MPEYEARIIELQKDVGALQNTMVEVERKGGPPAPLGTFVRLQVEIQAYAEVREKALNGSLQLLIPEGDATGESQQLRWYLELSRHGSEAFKRFIDMVSSCEKPIQSAFELLAIQESVGFSACCLMPIAKAVGQIHAHTRRLTQETRTLLDTWREQSGQEERMDGQIAGLRVQVLDTFKRAVADVRGWGPKTEQALHTGAEAWAAKEGSDPEPSLGSSAAEATKQMMETVGQLRRTHDDAARSAMSTYAGKLTVHQMFANTRLQVKEFLDKVNKDTVARLYREACEAAEVQAASLRREGQRADAKRFLEKAIAASGGVVTKFNEEWDRFYEAFKGVYVEEPTDATIEKLAEAEFFNRFWRDVEYLDLPGAFRLAEEAIARCESISLDRITPEQRKRMNEVIQERTREMKAAIRQMDMSIFQRAKLFYVDVPLDQLRDRLKRLPGFRK